MALKKDGPRVGGNDGRPKELECTRLLRFPNCQRKPVSQVSDIASDGLQRTSPEPLTIFTLRLETKPPGAVRRLRWLLKRLVRDYGLRCTHLREIRGRR
jgi:hypothetical protein